LAWRSPWRAPDGNARSSTATNCGADSAPTCAIRGRIAARISAAPLAVCEQRDPKGLYRKARSGEIAEFTGISDPYEPPTAPRLTLETHRLDVAACVARVAALLQSEN